eukprot:TRINITY_DN8238_c0_g2_i1.p1 TRINITY_DN8238_c0_g2~~TRINITY_DN8238_c0_g2_i1.p1  ORF type:complete len:106 (+),score=13.72 TRINITY_DN8238_c0_g2_i1:55-372(+)
MSLPEEVSGCMLCQFLAYHEVRLVSALAKKWRASCEPEFAASAAEFAHERVILPLLQAMAAVDFETLAAYGTSACELLAVASRSPSTAAASTGLCTEGTASLWPI